jgi:sugar/nucleoside kinase (ribokinase family)
VIVMPEGPLVRGSDRRATIRSRPGGSGANQAVWLGSMGCRVALVARIGAADKAALQAHFRGFGVEPLLIADTERPSGVLVTVVDPDGERSFLTDRGANLALSPEDVPLQLLDDAEIIVISGYSLFAKEPRKAVTGLLAAALTRGIEIAVDPASVGFLRELGAENFLSWTQGADLLFANAEEAELLTGTASLDEQVRSLGRCYKQVVVKRGALGAVLGSSEGIALQMAALAVPVVDSTGAGDAFAAAFISARIADKDRQQCLAAGIAAGAKAVGFIGGQPQAQ